MRKIIGWIIVLALLITGLVISFSIKSVGNERMALQSQTKFILDKKETTFDMAYNIDGNNYIQLRSVAQTLKGTNSQFNVYWDEELGKAIIETGVPYTGTKPIIMEKEIYKIGDTISIDNVEITISNASTISSFIEDGYTVYPTYKKTEDFYSVTFTLNILNPNKKKYGSYRYINDFIQRCVDSDGKEYDVMLLTSNQDSKIYPDTQTSTTVYFPIKKGTQIESIIVGVPWIHEEKIISVS